MKHKYLIYNNQYFTKNMYYHYYDDVLEDSFLGAITLSQKILPLFNEIVYSCEKNFRSIISSSGDELSMSKSRFVLKLR